MSVSPPIVVPTLLIGDRNTPTLATLTVARVLPADAPRAASASTAGRHPARAGGRHRRRLDLELARLGRRERSPMIARLERLTRTCAWCDGGRRRAVPAGAAPRHHRGIVGLLADAGLRPCRPPAASLRWYAAARQARRGLSGRRWSSSLQVAAVVDRRSRRWCWARSAAIAHRPRPACPDAAADRHLRWSVAADAAWPRARHRACCRASAPIGLAATSGAALLVARLVVTLPYVAQHRGRRD